ncbi:MAG TPA: hypothetical protein VFZ04_17750 [Longimicrobiales bacterium]
MRSRLDVDRVPAFDVDLALMLIVDLRFDPISIALSTSISRLHWIKVECE